VRAPSATFATAAGTDGQWPLRLESDRRAIAALVPARLAEVHAAVTSRATASGADALILSGSTARGCRTAISDLDYHLIGRPIDKIGLSRELDLHVLTPEQLKAQVEAGDDFVHWSLRFGLVVFDHGSVRKAVEHVAERQLWPDAERKRIAAAKSIDLARRFVATGDGDAAVVQVRTALSLAARAYLLRRRIFPLSRAELPGQLGEVGRAEAGAALTRCIHESPSLRELDDAVKLGAGLMEST
jgi:hypothetical protein